MHTKDQHTLREKNSSNSSRVEQGLLHKISPLKNHNKIRTNIINTKKKKEKKSNNKKQVGVSN